MKVYFLYYAMLRAVVGLNLNQPRALSLPRREFMRLIPFISAPLYVWAEDDTTVITDKILIELGVQLDAKTIVRKKIVIGLYGKVAPVSTGVFRSIAAGTLDAPCTPVLMNAKDRSSLTKRSIARQCEKDSESAVSYDGSQVWRILKGRRVDFGQLAGRYASRVAPVTPVTEGGLLSHNSPGLLSVARGGGVFDFTITLSPLPELDEKNVVIGKVLPSESDPDILNFLTSIPVIDYGKGDGPSSSRMGACYYGSQDTYCSQMKPLKKILVRTRLLS